MKAPSFWWDRRQAPVVQLLAPFAALYGSVAARRMQRIGVKATVPVICIGNFVAGGAGKTPTAIALAHALKQKGETPVFLTRGYRAALKGPVQVDLTCHDATAVGDEALLLAKIAATVVSVERAKGAAMAASLGTVILMDDGLQNPGLHKDFTLCVVDGGVGFGNQHCLPAGPLRAPLEAQFPKADAVLILGMGAAGGDVAELACTAQKPVFRSAYGVDESMTDHLAGRKMLAFAGIGRPDKFFETLGTQYVKLEQVRRFPDHHVYRDEDARALLEAARGRNLKLITTEKDYVKLKGSPALDELRAACLYLPVHVPLPAELLGLISDRLRQAG